MNDTPEPVPTSAADSAERIEAARDARDLVERATHLGRQLELERTLLARQRTALDVAEQRLDAARDRVTETEERIVELETELREIEQWREGEP